MRTHHQYDTHILYQYSVVLVHISIYVYESYDMTKLNAQFELLLYKQKQNKSRKKQQHYIARELSKKAQLFNCSTAGGCVTGKL
mmetsp:Transcript_31460/g.53079  ORF Transcript_31460/g.53079 Transcript_31460/m.53079 type:complete len:84 (+) Transcript_31460:90-341(+)